MKKKTILFIVSDVRSGSTLLENILSKSKEVISVGELHHLDSHLHKGKWGVTWDWNCSCGKSFSDCEFWVKVFAKMNISNFNEIENTQIKYTLNPTIEEIHKSQTALRLLDRIYKAVFEVSNVNTIIDSSKTPQQGKAIYQNSLFDVKVIHLKRDIRAVVISKNKWSIKFFDKKLNVYKILWKTFKFRLRCNKELEDISNKDVLNLNYEDFIKESQENLNLISEFVGFESFNFPEYMVLEDDHTVGGTPNRFAKRKIIYDEQWKETTRKKPFFNFIGYIFNKIA